MEPQPLKLLMVQGPREGETFEFLPGSTIRIGRVVRGNNLTVKDAGISSKHLVISSQSGKWIVQDLDSSNGTSLNSSKLPPFEPFDLHDGDTLKLGEYTSILVQFRDGEEPSLLRRNPRRKVNESDKTGRVAKNRGRRAEVMEAEEKSELERENVEILEESKPIRGRGRPRRARVLDKVKETDKGSGDLVSAAKKVEMQALNLGVTGGRKNEECVILENLGGECSKMAPVGRGRRKKLQDLPSENSQVSVLGNKKNMDTGLNLRKEAQDQTNEVGFEADKEIKCEIVEECEEKERLDAETNCENVENGGGLKESGGKPQINAIEDLEEGQETVDLEKMTLGQWFDYMEVHLPKQINEVTEEMIEEMRRKAERVGEYMIEQKKAKAVPTVG